MSQDTYPQPPDGWVCFHCGERFTTVGSAHDHFGARPTDMAACLIKVGEERGLVMALRKAQADALKAQAEVIRMTLNDVYGEVREEVRDFAIEMEERLRANDYKGGWKNELPQFLIARVREELEELDEAVDRIRANCLEDELADNVWHEAADVANFAMMVADAATGVRE